MKSRSRVSQRIAAVSPSATLAVTNKAKALRDEGKSLIGFGAGEPDFATPAHIVDAAVSACQNAVYHRYGPAAGLPALRSAIVEKTIRDSGYRISADQVVVTNGGKHAVYNAFQVLLDSGDEVIVPAPYWTTYPEAIALAGGTPTFLSTDETTGFRVTIEQLDTAKTSRTKALLFVSPSNPTGAVYSKNEIRAIGEWAVDNDVWVITDEIYEHLVYGKAEHYSLPVIVPEIVDRCIVLNGVAKTYAMTGWRVGWLIGPPDIAGAASTLQSHQTSNVANVSQVAALAALSGSLDAVDEMREAFARRRNLMHSLLNGIDGVFCLETEGAFYAFPNFAGVLGRSMGGQTPTTTLELAEVLLQEAEVAIVPGEAFGAPGYARLSFALSDEDLVEGVGRIASFLR